jgi:hypothetical protein
MDCVQAPRYKLLNQKKQKKEGVVETSLADVGGVASVRASPPCWVSLQEEALGRAWPVCGYARVGITPLLCKGFLVRGSVLLSSPTLPLGWRGGGEFLT